MEQLLDGEAAARWLTQNGVRRTKATLRKLRVTGGGPRYQLLNGRPYYTEADLAAWIEERLSTPQRSTSEGTGYRPRGRRGREMSCAD